MYEGIKYLYNIMKISLHCNVSLSTIIVSRLQHLLPYANNEAHVPLDTLSYGVVVARTARRTLAQHPITYIVCFRGCWQLRINHEWIKSKPGSSSRCRCRVSRVVRGRSRSATPPRRPASDARAARSRPRHINRNKVTISETITSDPQLKTRFL